MTKRIISLLTTLVMVISLAGVLPAVTAGALTYGDYEYEILDDGTVEITEYTGSDTVLDIPSEINKKTVTSIEFGAFAGTNLIKVTIPRSITNIGERVFNNCLSLKEINVNPNNPKYSSQDGILFNYDKTEIILYPYDKSESTYIIPNSVIFIANDAFCNCSLTSVLIPDSVTSIGDFAFYLCSSLTNIIIPNSVTNIGDFAFEDCMSLSNVQISNSLTTIGYATFAGCRLLNSITIPNSVTTIGRSAFGDCYSLTSITIPSSVTSIESSAFLNCSNLKDVYYTGNQEVWNNINIGDYNDALLNATIHYNSICENDYAIKLYSAMPALTVGVGQEINCAVQFEKDGMVINGNDGIDFQFIVDDSSILDISNIKKDSDKEKEGENGTWFTINGKKEGIVKLTITEINTGTVYYTNIQVSDGILSFSANCMPQYYEYNFEYNGFISGMYIDEFNFNESESTVSFNVYNSVSRLGVVDVYDANGNLVDCVPIERFDGNYVSSIKDTVVSGYKLLKDGFKKELMTYKQDSYSQKTPILNLKVPKGGRIEITNNINYSDTCAIANACALTVESLLTFSGSLSDAKEIKKVSNDTVGKIIKNNLKENVSKLGKKFIKTFAEKTYEEVGLSTLTFSMTDCINSFADVFENMNIDLFDLIIESSKSVGISVAEDALKAAMGSAGVVLDGLFLLSDYADLTSFYTTCGSKNPYNSLYIYIPLDNSSLCDNGVSIKPEDNSDYLLNGNYVLRSLVVTKDTILPDSVWRNLNDISSDYIVREIRLEKDGKESQPQKTVQVSVEIPKEYSQAKYCCVYWVKEDGTLETLKRPAIRQGKFLVFYVDHFSYYAIVALNNALNISPIPPTKSPSTNSPKVITKSNTKSTTIKKAKVKNLKVKAKGKKITVSWKKIKIAKDYQVQVATNKKFKKKKIVFDKFTKKRKLIIKSSKIKRKKTYYVRVRAYSKGNSKKVNGKWSKKIKVKIK